MRNKGYTLAELLVVMGMTSVIMTVGVGMMHRVMSEQKSAERDETVQRTAQRLTAMLRSDVHYAHRAQLIRSDDESEQKLVLSQPEESDVTYVVRKNEISRTSTRKDKQTHRDSFQFPDDCRLLFLDVTGQRVTFTATALPQLRVAPRDGRPAATKSEGDVGLAIMRVEAKVGRDHRFLSKIKEPIEP